MTMQCPAERDMHASASLNSRRLIVPARTSSLKRQTSVPDPMSSPRNFPFSIGPPETTSDGTSQLAAPMTRAGVVLSQPTISTTPSIGLARIDSSTSMLSEVSIEHGRRAHVRFASGGDRELERQASRLPDAALDVIRQGPQVGVTRGQFRPRIADADDRAPVEDVFRQPLVAHPAAMNEAVFVSLSEPGR